MSFYITPKYDYFLKRDLLPNERLGHQVEVVNRMRRELDALDTTLRNVSDRLTDKDLMIIGDAVDQAYHAVLNASRLGHSDFIPLPVRTINWRVEHEKVSF